MKIIYWSAGMSLPATVEGRNSFEKIKIRVKPLQAA